MPVFSTIAGVMVIAAVLLDAFETIVLPRRVQRHFRLTVAFYWVTWRPWMWIGSRMRSLTRRESFLGYFGPLSLIVLLACWAGGLIFGFTCLQYGVGEHLRLGNEPINFGVLLYHSGETFFTLGYGDIIPVTGAARALAVLEAGMGFAFLGVVIGYLPVVYASFASREIEISLLDSRAGSPPSASEFLRRLGCCTDQLVIDEIFRDWERWSAELLASHLSYTVLAFFRSQHGNQSWLGALTTMMDVTSLVISGVDGIHSEQAKLTFAMARHAAVDLSQILAARYSPQDVDRLPEQDLDKLRGILTNAGVRVRRSPEADQKLLMLRLQYEPYVQALSRRLLLSLPSWMPLDHKKDNWQAGPWDKIVQAKGLGRRTHAMDDHF